MKTKASILLLVSCFCIFITSRQDKLIINDLGYFESSGLDVMVFASGVGVKSLTQAYGVNRADLSYIPGAVASGTAIIRLDFPELKDQWSFLWQQTEYVKGGGAEDFAFLVLAANRLLETR